MDLSFELTSGKIVKSTKDSAAFDLFYSGSKPLYIGDRPITIPTGVKTKFTPGLVAIIKEKSGLALNGIELKAGVIDADYRDEWLVVARNPIQTAPLEFDPLSGEPCPQYTIFDPAWKPFRLNPGEKVAQFFLIELPKVHYYAMEAAELIYLDAVRVGGFGSTDSHAPLPNDSGTKLKACPTEHPKK